MPIDVIGNVPLNSNLPVDKEKNAVWTKPWGNWLTRAGQILFAASQSGTTAQRPADTKMLWIGRTYFDTSLGIPIWWNGTDWVDATGGVV